MVSHEHAIIFGKQFALNKALERGFYLSDEIYSGSRPILITVDAKSLAILKIELAPRRDGEQWQAHWEALTKAGYVGKNMW